MILKIRTYGDPVLRRQAETVTVFDEELAKLASDMAETMYDAPGVGLAAPQVGVSKRLIVVDVRHDDNPESLIRMANPEVVSVSAETERCDEGCLSVPDFSEPVTRPVAAVIRGQHMDGTIFTVEATGLLARCFLHEIDHLDGVLFVDRLMGFRRKLIRPRLKKHFGTLSMPDESSQS